MIGFKYIFFKNPNILHACPYTEVKAKETYKAAEDKAKEVFQSSGEKAREAYAATGAKAKVRHAVQRQQASKQAEPFITHLLRMRHVSVSSAHFILSPRFSFVSECH